MSLVTPWLLADRDRFSLMHGDYRLDNLLFDPDRTAITVVDWQTWASDCPPATWPTSPATSLLPETARRPSTSDLVAAYHDELLAYGVTDYDLDTCWRDYRVGMLQVPLISVLGCAFADLHRARRRHDAGHARARLPGHPRSRQPGPGQRALTHAAASATVGTASHAVGQWRPVHHDHGHAEIVGGVELAARHVAAAVLRHQRVDAGARRNSFRSSS